MTEIELAQKFIDYFENGEVYKEVPTPSGRCDIVVKQGPFYICIEVKKQLNFEVVNQAINNESYSNYSYIAVPYSKSQYSKLAICKKLQIGVLVYAPRKYVNDIQELVKPKYSRVIFKPRLLPQMKLSIAGAQHNSMSPFRVTVIEMENIVKRNGGNIQVKELFKERFHYSHTQSAKQCICRLINDGTLKQFSINKGIIKLNEQEA